MREISKDELQEILENHKHWLNRDCDGWESMRANLREADLRGVDLRGTDLRGVDLRGTDLRGVDLRWANLREAELREAELREADLRWADLRWANLREADLREANLREADLRWADLRGADLRGVDLDFSCLPLWCGSLHANFDSRQLKQIAYHLVKAGLQSKNATEEDKTELRKLIDYANGFHRAYECGVIEDE